MVEKRRGMMAAWGQFLKDEIASNDIPVEVAV
jgi:hypothetical protein